jgi:hypothetical protein
MFTSIPIEIEKGKGFRSDSDVEQSVRSFIETIVCTPCGGFEADNEFGFIFKNFRFQNFNEDKGVLFSNSPDDDASEYYKYKIQGRGINFNTFAFELKRNIELFEPRLKQVKVNMDYAPKTKTIEIKISGSIDNMMNDKFVHTIKMHVW